MQQAFNKTADRLGAILAYEASQKRPCMKIIERAIRDGADVNRRGERGQTALMYAAWRGHGAIAALLLSAGADPGMTNAGGRTASEIALLSGHHDLARQLASAERTFAAAKRPAPPKV
jgi:ankyrin repeat protein